MKLCTHTHRKSTDPRCGGMDRSAVNEWIYAGGKHRPHGGEDAGHSESHPLMFSCFLLSVIGNV